eukprot:323293-Chlamydomonas_euryale.AAC.8
MPWWPRVSLRGDAPSPPSLLSVELDQCCHADVAATAAAALPPPTRPAALPLPRSLPPSLLRGASSAPVAAPACSDCHPGCCCCCGRAGLCNGCGNCAPLSAGIADPSPLISGSGKGSPNASMPSHRRPGQSVASSWYARPGQSPPHTRRALPQPLRQSAPALHRTAPSPSQQTRRHSAPSPSQQTRRRIVPTPLPRHQSTRHAGHPTRLLPGLPPGDSGCSAAARAGGKTINGIGSAGSASSPAPGPGAAGRLCWALSSESSAGRVSSVDCDRCRPDHSSLSGATSRPLPPPGKRVNGTPSTVGGSGAPPRPPSARSFPGLLSPGPGMPTSAATLPVDAGCDASQLSNAADVRDCNSTDAWSTAMDCWTACTCARVCLSPDMCSC